MIQIKISDLEFCRKQLSEDQQVTGGFYIPNVSVSTAVGVSVSTNVGVGVNVYLGNGYSYYQVGFGASGGYGLANSYAVSIGGYTSAGAGAYTGAY